MLVPYNLALFFIILFLVKKVVLSYYLKNSSKIQPFSKNSTNNYIYLFLLYSYAKGQWFVSIFSYTTISRITSNYRSYGAHRIRIAIRVSSRVERIIRVNATTVHIAHAEIAIVAVQIDTARC